MINTGITQEVVSFEKLRQDVNKALSDPYLEKEDWKATTSWGKTQLVSLMNQALALSDPRKKELLTSISVFGVRHGYQIGVRLDNI